MKVHGTFERQRNKRANGRDIIKQTAVIQSSGTAMPKMQRLNEY